MSKVFISYSHDSAHHSERVLQFANALRSDGVDAEIDRYHVRPPKGWPHWFEEQMRPENSDFILMICTETYLKRIQDGLPVDEGLGVFWEGSIINHYIFDTQNNTRFIPVLLDGASKEWVPRPIRGHTRYDIASFDLADSGYAQLYRELTAQSLNAPSSLTIAAPLPPRLVQTTFPIIETSRLFRSTSSRSDLLVGREDELKVLEAAWSGSQKKNVITIVAWGGVGKTSLAARWAANTLAQANHGGIERYFDWSFYSQGTRIKGDATGPDKVASADVFVKEALEFFGDPELAASNAGGWQKGERLARLVAEHRTLLILDGLDALQDANSGELSDVTLRALLRGLASNNRGLCLVTSRQQLPELNTWQTTTAPTLELAGLSTEAGGELLKELGVKGTTAEREQLATDVKCHALTLTLMGKYLTEAHHGDIRKRDLVSLTAADYDETSGHAFHVMEAYEQWLYKDGRHMELAILRILGLFDRAATPDCLAALRRTPAIPGLTDMQAPLPDAQWNLAIKHLVQVGLVEEQPWDPRRVIGYGEALASNASEAARQGRAFTLGEPQPFFSSVQYSKLNSIDSHPLIREYFGRRLRETEGDVWRAAHSRLFEHLSDSVPWWPEGLDGLQPLYQAVAHGCQAGRYPEALERVYVSRILRGTVGPNAFYSERRLGAVGENLRAVACFFVTPWTRPATELIESDQVWLLHEAARFLRALGRLAEAREPMRISMERRIEQANWQQAAISASNLSQIDLTRGDVASAVREAEQSVVFADRSGDAFLRMGMLTVHADVLHQAGSINEARERFEEAEGMQQERQPDQPLLYSSRGFWFCDLLLADTERAAWRAVLSDAGLGLFAGALSPLPSRVGPIGIESSGEPPHSKTLSTVAERASQTLEWARTSGLSLLAIALDHLTLGRAALYRAMFEPSLHLLDPELSSHLDEAINGLRQSGDMDVIPAALLTRAWLRAVLGQTAEARADLDEAQQLAERDPMPLLLIDVHLHRARLFFRDDLVGAREDLKQARALVVKHGYLRRREELEDAEKVVLAAGPQVIPRPPDELLRAFAAKEVVLYAGAGLSHESGLPLWPEFVRSLLEFAVAEKAVDKGFAESLQATLRDRRVDFVADSVVSALRERRPGSLEEHLRKILRSEFRLSDVHIELQKLNFRAVMTPNFDDLLELAFRERLPRIYTPRVTDELLTAISKREFFILKLYGDVFGGNDVLVAPAQYEDAIRGNRAFSSVMETLFFSSTILFLGASLEGIEAYLRGINLPGAERRTHYALVAVSGTAWKTSADILKRRYGIEVLPIDDAGHIGGRVLSFVRQFTPHSAPQAELPEVPETRPIGRLALYNVGPFESLELKLDPQWNVILGDNGVGKSSILRAIATALIGRQAQFGERLIKSGAAGAEITIDIGRTSYKTEIFRTTSGTEVVSHVSPIEAEGVLALGFPALRTVSWDRPRSPQVDVSARRPAATDLHPLIAGGLDPRVDDLKQWIVSMDYRSRLSSTGAYVSVLKTFFDIVGKLAEGMTIEFDGVDPQTYDVQIKTADGPLRLEALSQGTISLLGWIGILLQRLSEVFADDSDHLPLQRRPAIVLIDEIDAHLHPAWQQILVRRLSAIFPNVQFIATTHSPLIVGGMQASQMFRFARDEDGKVASVVVEDDMTVGRTDQILTSDLFGLNTTLDTETREVEEEYRKLLGRRKRTTDEEARMRELEGVLRFRIPPSAETPVERQAYELLEALLIRSAGGVKLAGQKEVLEAGKKLLDTLTKKKKATRRSSRKP